MRELLKANRHELYAPPPSDAKAIILQLEHECTRMHKDLRVAQAKVAQQKMDLEAARDREVAAHDRLSRAVSTAEKAIAERETFARIVSLTYM